MIKQLLKIERVKLLHYVNAKVILALHLGLFALVLFVVSQVKITFPGFSSENLFRFPYIWNVTAWFASWFNLLLAILVMVITCNEYSFKTFRQSLIDGLSRNDLFAGKSAVIFSLALYAALLVVLLSVVLGVVYTRRFDFSDVISNAWLTGIYFVQAIGYMYLGFLIANLLKNPALSIVSFLVLRLIAEPVLRQFFPSAIRQFFPFKVITGLTPMPEVLTITSETGQSVQPGQSVLNLSEIGLVAPPIPLYITLLVAIGYIFLFAALSWYIIRKRDF